MRDKARAQVCAWIDRPPPKVRWDLLKIATAEELLGGMDLGPSWSRHPMQTQPREDNVAYYERRKREAQAQSDAHKGEVYDDDNDRWVRTLDRVQAGLDEFIKRTQGWDPAQVRKDHRTEQERRADASMLPLECVKRELGEKLLGAAPTRHADWVIQHDHNDAFLERIEDGRHFHWGHSTARALHFATQA